jgi:DNA-directed RNA polymerase subunit RPC12/RpoP
MEADHKLRLKEKSLNVKCNDCGKHFTRNGDFEEHLEENKAEKSFECEKCGKKYYLEWRLGKHMDMNKGKGKYSPYFNNGEPCPFEIIGCMFVHERSGMCRFKECKNLKCQFEHTRDEISNHENMETDSEVENPVDGTSSTTYGENDCHLCDKVFECMNNLCEYFESEYVEYH